MNKSFSHHSPALPTPLLLRSLQLVLLMLILMGAQGAFACQQKTFADSRTITILPVTGCHVDIRPKTDVPCCNSAACHRNSTPLRNLANPEFANQIKDMQPALTESRQTSPQPRSNTTYIFINYPSQPARQLTSATSSTVPRLALSMLKTTVLLH